MDDLKWYVVAKNNDNIAILDESKTKYEADLMLEWHKAHMWLYADNIEISVKNSKEFF